MSPPRQRRRLLINNRYQLRHLAVILTANLLLMLLISALVSWFYLLFFKGNLVCNHNRLFPLYLAATTLVVVALLTLWCLNRSRCVAGMMRKIEMVLAEAAQGRLTGQRLAFRKNDYFAALADPINDCITRMNLQNQQQMAAAQALRELQLELAQRPEEGDAVHRKIETIIAGLNNQSFTEH